MTPSYSLLQNLIGRFAEYDRAARRPSLADFGTWLAEREAPAADPAEPFSADRAQARYYDALPPDYQLGALLGRLSQFAHRYAAEVLAGLPVGSPREFGVLATVGLHGNPNKTEVAYTNLLELSTVTEITRRLVQAGLLRDLPDRTDRRTRRLQLTPEGQRVLAEAQQRMGQLNERLFGPLPAPDRAQLLRLLHALNDMHTTQFFAPNANPPAPDVPANG
ncbi:winged helix DNA-binding protein [Hymenobacter sp. BT664]|uniref:Winged helix DNA-binding protein n=1 Tax=Hymenobacter montanus TaxID=2771359 RepID=A0A927BF97_9BACT|nr:MarR family transcriptional regulator [Hymenobacter montanus]MBD2769792.1 winged helix DNA-binding protein [Hymenobacter montanus]